MWAFSLHVWRSASLRAVAPNRAQAGVVRQAQQSAAQGGAVARGANQAALPVAHQCGDLARITGHDGEAAGYGTRRA